MRTRRAREVQDAIGGKRADGQIVVPGPAEPAEIRASADHFDEEARSELRVGRKDDGRWWIQSIGCLDGSLADNARCPRVRLRVEGGEFAVGRVTHIVKGGDVK